MDHSERKRKLYNYILFLKAPEIILRVWSIEQVKLTAKLMYWSTSVAQTVQRCFILYYFIGIRTYLLFKGLGQALLKQKAHRHSLRTNQN